MDNYKEALKRITCATLSHDYGGEVEFYPSSSDPEEIAQGILDTCSMPACSSCGDLFDEDPQGSLFDTEGTRCPPCAKEWAEFEANVREEATE